MHENSSVCLCYLLLINIILCTRIQAYAFVTLLMIFFLCTIIQAYGLVTKKSTSSSSSSPWAATCTCISTFVSIVPCMLELSLLPPRHYKWLRFSTVGQTCASHRHCAEVLYSRANMRILPATRKHVHVWSHYLNACVSDVCESIIPARMCRTLGVSSGAGTPCEWCFLT